MDAELIAALDDLEKAEAAVSDGDVDSEEWFHQAAMHVVYRWIDYKGNPNKPPTGAFQTGMNFTYREDGFVDIEPI